MNSRDDEIDQQDDESSIGDPAKSDPLPANDLRPEADRKCSKARESPAGENGKLASSSKKVEANRRNSLNSTGPKTSAGKRRTSQNAIKHGFFSKCLLVQHQDGRENKGEYDDLYRALRRHYQPKDFLEGLWTEKIAVWTWRLRRLLRCESGQIARALAEHSYELQQSKADDLAEPESAPSSSPEMDAMTDHLFLPEKEELDKLLRYEAMINRQLNHAIGELERVQVRRKEGSTAADV